MNSNLEIFSKETERARRVYTAYEVQGHFKTVWSPFNEVEAEYRSQQWLVFSRLMREAGLVDLEGLRVLDVGCSTGRLLRMFLDMGAKPQELYGIDINQEFIAIAQSLAPHLNYNTFNGWGIEFPDSHFDLVTQFVVFSSIALAELRSELASEMMRVLKPGGHIFWWDMPHMATDAGEHDKPLDAYVYFPDMPMKAIHVGMRVAPSECLRPLRGVKRILGPFLDKLGYPHTHIAALFGPKP